MAWHTSSIRLLTGNGYDDWMLIRENHSIRVTRFTRNWLIFCPLLNWLILMFSLMLILRLKSSDRLKKRRWPIKPLVSQKSGGLVVWPMGFSSTGGWNSGSQLEFFQSRSRVYCRTCDRIYINIDNYIGSPTLSFNIWP